MTAVPVRAVMAGTRDVSGALVMMVVRRQRRGRRRMAVVMMHTAETAEVVVRAVVAVQSTARVLRRGLLVTHASG